MFQKHITAAFMFVVCFSLTDGSAFAQSICPVSPAAFQELRARVLTPRPDQIIVVAHRACFAGAAENSPEAVDACWRMGVEVVENDVRRTKDGHLVIFHDNEISRMTDRWGYVADMTLAELRQARLKENDGAHHGYREAFVTDRPITTLEEYLSAVRHRVMVNFEIKYANTAEFVSIFNQSVAMARQMGVLDHLVFKIPDVRHHGAQSPRHMLENLDLGPDIQLMPMIWESEISIADRLAFFDRYKPIGFEVPFQRISYFQPIKSIQSLSDRPIMAVAVQPYWSGGLDDRLALRDPAAAWGRLIDMGADHIMTDRPEALIRYLEATNRRAPRKCKAG